MGDFTLREWFFAIAGSIGGVSGVIAIFNSITARLDKRRERKQIDVSQSADLRRVRLEEERLDEGIWESVSREKEARIVSLKAEVKELKDTIKTARHTFDELETMFRRLRVAKIPDEVVDILAEKINRAVEAINRGRDALG